MGDGWVVDGVVVVGGGVVAGGVSAGAHTKQIPSSDSVHVGSSTPTTGGSATATGAVTSDAVMPAAAMVSAADKPAMDLRMIASLTVDTPAMNATLRYSPSSRAERE